jgi:hypothetical protein
MAYRAGELRVDDPEAGELRVTGDGYAAAGEVVTLLVSPDVHLLLGMSEEEVAGASEIDRRYREALRQLYSGGQWRPPHVDLLPRCRRDRRSSGRSDDCSERSALRVCAACPGGSGVETRFWMRTWPASCVSRRSSAGRRRRWRRRTRPSTPACWPSAARCGAAGRSSDSAGLQGWVVDTDEAGSARLLALLTPEQQEQFTRLRADRG